MLNLKFNFFKQIKSKLFPFYKNNNIKFVFRKLHEGFSDKDKSAMFVGGCVRKYLRNEKINDIDIATLLTTEQIKEKFKNTNFKVIESGVKHGTITIIQDDLKLEITTLRKDVKTDGRHAEIEYTRNWQVDSERRDFTINAIYLDIKGNLYDPQQGISDLRNNIVKFIGDPQKRIQEDYLRIIRFIRFSLEYESKIEKTSLDAINLNLDGIKKISKERILDELMKMIHSKKIINIHKEESLKKIFLLIFPEFKNLDRLKKLEEISPNLDLDKEIILGAMLIDEKDNHEYFSHKYNVSNELSKNLSLLAKNFQALNSNKRYFSKDLKKNLYLLGKKNLVALHVLNFSDNKKTNLQEYISMLRKIKETTIPKFSYDGNFLKEHGMQEGILIGQTLKLIESEWINGDFKISDEKVLEIISSQKG